MDIATLYVTAQRSFCELFASLDDGERALPVPCNPLWSVRDVLSHVAGIADDVVEGRVEGAATDPWTAVQVERWRGTDWRALVDQWSDQAPMVGSMLAAIEERRPPLDCHSHEHDVRHAVGRAGNQDSDLIRWMSTLFDDSSVGRSVEVHFADGATTVIDGDDPAIELRNISRFEFVRSRLGRRSRAQVAAYAWSEAPHHALLDEWFVFGPASDDIDE
ncbi:MAG: maleylpyruvate isomerase N-terminal domain-containing protein [Ilumatobacter sp.]|uniref:maleylpyruvate isomerase N-terminal domain-containing protein n=1 Tax=Ilumatobacter sp. TaxID=1967498 RepID=UPI00261717DC|nr:maleylpyruvate isomerase N-terminal domain-containing protein [Ilumatobacter sp.]MDJ0767677.1 maleylpyruvate isomerase N-terminal domain-containing protein [Ilumatobacter sp.]